ncbi:hypothetical protein [Bacillus sp. PK3_68]|nr:hypothetical protein [Bacillus sp. PK3_68]
MKKQLFFIIGLPGFIASKILGNLITRELAAEFKLLVHPSD